MAKIVGKGTALQLSIASTFTTIAQLTSITLPEAESETVECDTLDNANAGIPYAQTGRTEGGSCSFEGYIDPVAATFQAVTDLLTTPADASWKIIFSDAATTEWTFTGAGVSIGGSVDTGSLSTFSGSIKLDGIVAYPT